MRPRTVRITIGMIIWAAFFFGLAMIARGAVAGVDVQLLDMDLGWLAGPEGGGDFSLIGA